MKIGTATNKCQVLFLTWLIKTKSNQINKRRARYIHEAIPFSFR